MEQRRRRDKPRNMNRECMGRDKGRVLTVRVGGTGQGRPMGKKAGKL